MNLASSKLAWLAPVLLALSVTSAGAQSSTKPLTLIVPYAAGGSTDQIARILADKLKDPLGRPVVVDNKPGAGGRLAASQVKDMAADGSVAMITLNALIVQSIIYAGKTKFDLLQDFAPVAKVASVPLAVAVPATSPIKNMKDLIAHAKSSKEGASYGSSGAGSLAHLSGHRLAKLTGINWTHVAYKGGAPMTTDLLGGHLEAGVDTLADFMENHRGGRIRVLATFTNGRSPLAQEVPSLGEQGINGVNADVWFGILVPAKTPAPAITQLQNAIEKALLDSDVKARLNTMVARVDYLPAAKFGPLIRQEFEVWKSVVLESGVTPE